MTRFFLSKFVTKDFSAIETDRRMFEGYLTVEMVDKQNEITMVDELMKVLPIWMARGAPISDTHSNRIIGKGINFAKTTMTDEDGHTYPAIYITGEIYKDYELDNDIWEMMKTGEYKGLSFGGATKAGRRPVKRSDGGFAYSLWDLEHYEVAVCRDPAVPLALVTRTNDLAKAMAGNWIDRGNGDMCIQCDNFSCYIDKATKKDPQGNEWSNDPPVEVHDTEVEIHNRERQGDHIRPSDQNSEYWGTSKTKEQEKEKDDEGGKGARPVPLIGELTTSPKIRPTSVAGGGTYKDNTGATGSNGDYNLNLTEVEAKPEKKKQTVSTTMTGVGDVKDTVNDDKEAPALEKDLGGGMGNQNMPGTRGFGATQQHMQGSGQTAQIRMLDKDPPPEKDDKKQKVHMIDSDGNKWYEESQLQKIILNNISYRLKHNTI